MNEKTVVLHIYNQFKEHTDKKEKRALAILILSRLLYPSILEHDESLADITKEISDYIKETYEPSNRTPKT